MRSINLASYAITLPTPEGPKPDTFNVRASLVESCFSPSGRGVAGSELLQRNKLAMKIEAWPNDQLLLDEAEYQRLVAAIESGEMNVGRWGVEFVRRVLEAPTVPVEPVPAEE